METKMDNFTKLVHLAAHSISDIYFEECAKAKIDKSKISQILWYTDIYYYVGYGKYITDASYQKGEHGVIISDGKLEKALDYLISKKYIVCCDGCIFEFNNLEDSEDILNDELKDIFTNISMHVHVECIEKFFWWEILKIGEEIPKYCAFAVAGKINKDDLEWATQEVRKQFINSGKDALDRLKSRQKEVTDHINVLNEFVSLSEDELDKLKHSQKTVTSRINELKKDFN